MSNNSYYNDQWRIINEPNQNKVSNYSMDFDGSSQYVDTPQIDLGSTNSISFWINKTSTAQGTLFGDPNGSINYSLFIIPSTNSIYFRLGNGDSGYWQLTVSSGLLNDGNWHHHCLTRNGVTLSYYIDGVLQTNVVNNTLNASAGTNTTIENIMAKSDGTLPLSGKLDGVSIFGYALSSSQVTTLYGSSSTGIGSPMSLSPKPISYYQLGEQSVDNGANYLVPNNSLSGYVFDFDSANNEYIDLGTTPFSFTQNLTVSFWVKTSQTSLNSFIGKDSNVVTNGRNWMIYQNNDKVNFWTTSTGNTSNPPLSITISNTSINDNQWHHIVCVNDYVNSTRQIYIDGILDITDNNGTAISTSSTPVRIGSRDISTGFPYDGEMSNVALWSTALTASQVETIYNNGTPNDISSLSPLSWYKLNQDDSFNSATSTWTFNDYAGNNDGTSVSMDSSNIVLSYLIRGTSGYSPYTLDLDSANLNVLNCGNDTSLQATTAITISAWVYFNSGSENFRQGIVSRIDYNGTDPSNINYSLSLNKRTTGSLDRLPRITSGSSVLIATSGIRLFTWGHVAVTIDSSGATMYVNGFASGTDSSFTINSVANADFIIGNSHFAASTIDGRISNLAVWSSTALTSTEITEIYNQGIPSDLHTFSGTAPTSWWQIGSNSSFNSSTWTCLDEIGTNNAVSSANMTNDDIVNGVGYIANGLGTSSIDIKGDAPYSTANGISQGGMDVLDRSTDVPS